jgi:penicillin-binding protein 1A
VKPLVKILIGLMAFLFAACVVVALVIGGYLFRLSRDLPDYASLANYAPPITTRMHGADGTLIAEYARERRLFVPIASIPPTVINAFLSAEDKNFFEHGGVDFSGVIRAIFINIGNVMHHRRPEGASTITQQVAKNFLLSSEVSMGRKIKEAMLAIKIEKAYTKEQILELYLNEIYLGNASYGVAAAALNYFDKSLTELTTSEAAFLGALPKAPNNYNPFNRMDEAVGRRNWVLERMAENGFINRDSLAAAKAEPLNVRVRPMGAQIADAKYFAEEVRRQVYGLYGEQSLYDGGLSIRTTLDMQMQQTAIRTLRGGLAEYDERHGWRGPITKIDVSNWKAGLAKVDIPSDIAPWTKAAVLEVAPKAVTVGLANGTKGVIPFEGLSWARKFLSDDSRGPEVRQATDVLSAGDVVYVEPWPDGPAGRGGYKLRQMPAVNGGIVALDPHTGRVLAMVGGFSFDASVFNRATQAYRQTGSAFKPFVYAAALDRGYTPSSIILDAPFVLEQAGQETWRPENYEEDFAGPATLRFALEHSRNAMTVRVAAAIGMGPIVENAKKFGIKDDMMPVLSMAIGAGETTLLKLTTAYGMIVNGGKKIAPSLIDRIQDRKGHSIFKNDQRPCASCNAEYWANQAEPQIPDEREQVLDPTTAYQLVSLMEGVVQRGTGSVVKAVDRPLAGKTGTTNDERDAWFVGFAPDLTVGVFVGFDNPHHLGKGETGGHVAAPIFRDFMKVAVGTKPAVPFRIPPGITFMRVDLHSGQLADPDDQSAILEAFKEGTAPGSGPNLEDTPTLSPEDQNSLSSDTASPGATTPNGPPAAAGASAPSTGTGGLY